jgi:GntR family transcriptional repressor for pyruvate dehydrogenase complex
MAKEQKEQSARQRFISEIEQKILSGELAVDQKLPPERDLAEQTGISRTIVHAGLIELATKNVLRIIPRQGTYVNDFKKEGTLELYGALLQYTGKMEPDILQSLIELREIVETEAAGKAAAHHTPQDVKRMRELLRQEREAATAEEAALLDYRMHIEITRASGNIVFLMTLRSIEPMYMSLVKAFYDALHDRRVVHSFHERLITALEGGDAAKAAAVMKAMIGHGNEILKQYYPELRTN